MSFFVRSLTPRVNLLTILRSNSANNCPPANTHRGGGYKIYKYLTFLVGFPAIIVVAAMTFGRKQECHERPPFVPYENMRRRTKRFPWGDGNKSLFHNPAVNPLPDGYEVTEQLECEAAVDEEEEEEAHEK